MAKPNCYNCVHRRQLAWSSHSKCNNVEAKVKGHWHGIERGWFLWPVNFDPVWLLACNGFSNNSKDRIEVKHSSFLELLALMGSR